MKKVVLLSPEQVAALITALEEPYNLMVLVAASLGLRVEEVVALQWDDFDFAGKTLTIRRALPTRNWGSPSQIHRRLRCPSPMPW